MIRIIANYYEWADQNRFNVHSELSISCNYSQHVFRLCAREVGNGK